MQRQSARKSGSIVQICAQLVDCNPILRRNDEHSQATQCEYLPAFIAMALFSSGLSRKSGPLERLKKVVVLEDVRASRNVLATADASVEDILRELESLSKVHISLETLTDTRIGVTVNKLRKHTDERIKEASAKLVCLDYLSPNGSTASAV